MHAFELTILIIFILILVFFRFIFKKNAREHTPYIPQKAPNQPLKSIKKHKKNKRQRNISATDTKSPIQPVCLNIEELRQNIVYPPLLREAGIQGRGVFRIFIDEKGNYVEHIIISPFHPFLAQEVEKHLPKIRFLPLRDGKKMTKFWVDMPFNFRLE